MAAVVEEAGRLVAEAGEEDDGEEPQHLDETARRTAAAGSPTHDPEPSRGVRKREPRRGSALQRLPQNGR